MGSFTVTIEFGDPAGSRFEPREALVDTGATYTLAPASLLRDLGVEPSERASFELADGTTTELDLGETRVRIGGQEITTVVVFGPEGTAPLLGAYTLERLRLAVDPVRRQLIPVPGRLMRARR